MKNNFIRFCMLSVNIKSQAILPAIHNVMYVRLEYICGFIDAWTARLPHHVKMQNDLRAKINRRNANLNPLVINLIIIIKVKYLTHVHVKIVSQSISNKCCKAQKKYSYIDTHIYRLFFFFCHHSKYAYHLVSRYPQRIGIVFVHVIACFEFLYTLTWYTCLSLCVCEYVFGILLVFINSIFDFFLPLFTAFSKSSCVVITMSLTLLLTYKTHWLSKINLSLKYTHIDFCMFIIYFFFVSFTLAHILSAHFTKINLMVLFHLHLSSEWNEFRRCVGVSVLIVRVSQN